MSNDILGQLIGGYQMGFGMVSKFVDVSTDETWKATSGTFPGWQQVYHAMECVFFFLAPVDAPDRPSMYPMDVMLLQNVSAPVPSKAAIKALCEEANAFAEKYFATLTDADLTKPHEGLTQRMGRPMTIMSAISTLSGHFLYHLGYLDAILKENGQPTIF